MPLGMEVGLGPGDFVFDGEPGTVENRHSPPIFGPCLLWPNGWMDQDATWYGGKPRPRRRCVRRSRSCPIKGAQPLVFGSCILWPNGWIDEDTTWYRIIDLSPGHIVLDGVPALRESCTAAPPPLFGPCLLWPRSPTSATAELLFKAVLTNRLVDYRWLQQTQLISINLGHASNTQLKALQQQLD